MAEIDLQAEINTPSEIGIANPFGASEREVAEQQTRDNVDKATYHEKQSAFFYQALKSNTAKKIFDWTFSPSFEPDPAFENNDDVTLETMKHYNVGMKHYGAIRDSKSYAEMMYHTRAAFTEDNIDTKIENSLTNRAKTTASVVGAIADVDIAIGFGVGAFYKAGTSLAKITAIEGTAEAGLAATHYLADEKYTLEDAAFDMVLGTSVAVGATKLFNSFDASSTQRLSNEFSVQTSDNAKWTTDALMGDTSSAIRPLDTMDSYDIRAQTGIHYTDIETISKISKQEVPSIYKSQLDGTQITENGVPTVVWHTSTVSNIQTFKKDKKSSMSFAGSGEAFYFSRDSLDKSTSVFGANKHPVYLNITNPAKAEVIDFGYAGSAPRIKVDDKLIDLERLSNEDILMLKSKGYDGIEWEGADGVTMPPQIVAFSPTQILNAGITKKVHTRPANKYTTTKSIDDIKNEVSLERVAGETQAHFDARVERAVNEKFNAPEYAQYKSNRDNFFDTQKRINEITLAKELEEIDVNIKSFKQNIVDVESKLQKTKNKAWKTRLKKQLDENKQKLADEQSKLKVSLDKKPLTRDELNFQRTIDSMVDDIQVIKKEIDEIITSAKNGGELESLTTTVEELHKRLPKETQELFSKFKSAVKNKGFDGNKLKADIIKSKKLTNKQKTIIAGALLVGGSSLSAANGESIAGDITLGFILTVAVLALAPYAISKIKDANIRSMVRDTKRNLEQSYQKAKMSNSPQANTVRNVGAMIAQDAKTRLTSTVAPFEKAGGQAAKIIGDLLYSAKTGAGAETIKSAWAHATLSKYSVMERQTFKMWKAENGITFTKNFMNDMQGIHEFRKLVTDNMELRNSKSPAIIALTKQNDELMAHMWSVSKEYKVYGFEKIDYKAGMIPRLWRHDTMSGIVKQLSKSDKLVLRDALANAIYKTSADMVTANKQADRFVEIWTHGFDAKRNPSNAEDIFGQVADMLKDDVEYKDFADRFNTSKDRSSRTKFRIDFDINDFEKLELDGGKFVIDKSILVEREFKTILDQTANTMYGAAALARHGYTSTKALDIAISSVDDASLRNELHIASDLVKGIPVASNSKQVHELSMIAKDLTIVAKLPLVVFSLPPEFAFTLANAGVSKGVRALVESVLSTFGRDSQMMSSLSDISGLSTSVSRMDWSGYRAVTNDLTEMDDMGIVNKLREGTVKMRDASMIVNGLSYFSDVLQRANMALNAEKFANFIIKNDTNPTSGINPSRLKSFGIDDATATLFKDAFEFTDKGRLKAVDTSKWTNKQKDKFAEVLRDMNQQVTPETTIGETGLWTRSTGIGRILSALTAYPMQQFNVHGLEDLRHLDRMSLMHSVGGFAGSYIGLHARYTVQNKEIDDEKIVLYSLMNMPILGGLSAMSSIVAPATQDTVKDGLSVIGIGQ